ncbi:MAG: DUF308 domain-containing protein [Mycobacterium sp.]
MLITALVLAVIGLAALVFAVVTSNALVAWVCIGASALGVLLLIIDALAERRRHEAGPDEPPGGAEPAPEADDSAGAIVTSRTADTANGTYENADAEYPDESDAEGRDEDPAAQHTDQGDADATVSDDQNTR